LARLSIQSKPQLLKSVEDGRYSREKARLLRLEQNAQRAGQHQIQQARVPTRQHVIQDYEGVRRLSREG
jgi:hypothetical protein